MNPPPHTTPREPSALGIAQPPLSGGLAHACFLERLNDVPEGAEGDRQAALGAFLVMRVVDKLGPQAGDLSAEAFSYQLRATERHLAEDAEEAEDSAERAHLDAIVRAVHAAWQRQRTSLLAPSLLAYGHFLEHELRLAEAEDVLDTLLQVTDARLSAADRIAATLFLARVNRKLARFDEAEAGYRAGAALAAQAGDDYSALLSRIGLALVRQYRGDLPSAEGQLREVIAEAGTKGLRDAEARAQQDLANVLERRGQPLEAIHHAFRSFQLYEEDSAKTQALVNIGILLRQLGANDVARAAFTLVAHSNTLADARLNAQIELMEIASRERDRLGFERHREAVARCEDRLHPPDRADFLLKCGLAMARFGQFSRAEKLLEDALAVASANGLHEFEFLIERIRGGLHACRAELGAEPADMESKTYAELDDVATALRRLAGAVAVP